ncbi:MAG: alpha/beta hydrolase [Planctomycetota bacterium]|nr:alpha/beta hydrolase [Planctomycetota bacterium]
MRRTLAAFLLASLVFAGGASRSFADEKRPAWPWVYPGGESTQQIDGLSCTLYVPRRLTPKSGSSLLVLLHGARARGSRLATIFRFWPRKNYVVCAPQASGPVWTPKDLARVRRIVKTLQARLPLDPDRVHVAGFSNGASNLHAVAFADDVKARSGTWVGGGFPPGAAVPAWARERFGALFMAGENDFAKRRVVASPPLLQGKVRSVELLIEPVIGHTWPMSQIEYHLWWMGVQEGRFAPGDDLNFDWDFELADALDEVREGEAPGILFYLYDSKADRDSASTRMLQHGTFMDPQVRRLGRRLLTVKVDKQEGTAALAKLGVPALATPAVVLFDAQGRQQRVLSGAIDVPTLRGALEHLLTPARKR